MHPIFGAAGSVVFFQHGQLNWENNLNNFYNFEQRFARTSPLRGPCRPRVAARETTMNNASPGQQGCCFPLLSKVCPRESSIHGTLVVFCCLPCSRIATREACKVVTCCKSCICCFSLLSRDCPREGSIHGTLVVFCCSPCSRIATRNSVQSSISWYPFSPWQSSSELGFAHGLSKAL